MEFPLSYGKTFPVLRRMCEQLVAMMIFSLFFEFFGDIVDADEDVVNVIW